MKSRVWRLVPALFCLLTLPCGAVSVAAADDIPNAAAIREKIAAAEGALPETFRETDEIVSTDGGTTIEHDYTRGKNFRYTFDTGPFHAEYGVSNGEEWHMNENGQVVLDQPDPGAATVESIATTVSRIQTPIEGYLLSTLNIRGNGRKEYVDSATWRIVRSERITPNGTITRTYDDVRLDHGRTFPHHVHVDDRYEKTTADVRVVEYVPDEVSSNDVAIPNPRRALVTFPAGTPQVELPATFGDAHIYVRVMIGNRGLDFVLDTGAGDITIDETVARELGLPAYQKHSTVTAQRHTEARTIIPEMRVGSLVMRDVAVHVIPHGWQTASYVKEVGLLGFDFLAELGVTIDYEHHRVVVVPGASYAAPTDQYAIPLDVRIGSGQPYATVSLNGATGERWILDTGGAGTFLILDYFARRHPEALRDRGGGGDQRLAELYGIGGRIPARPYQIASLKLANVNFTDFVGYRVTGSGTYASDEDGVIGPDFLRLFTLGLDYGNSRIYLVPNRFGRKAMGIK